VILNNFNWGSLITNYDAGNFGQINSIAGDRRISEVAVEYGF